MTPGYENFFKYKCVTQVTRNKYIDIDIILYDVFDSILLLFISAFKPTELKTSPQVWNGELHIELINET